jgi:probable F420-dependent oxidoreductase
VAVPTIRFGLQAGLESDPRAFTDLARRAEDSGFEAFYVADHPGVTASPFAALTAAALATSTLKIGTYVLNCGIRDPLAIASAAATVDVLSNGRFVLGLGAGHTPAEWSMSGRRYPTAAERVARLTETVEVVPRLLAGEVVSHDGPHVHLDDAQLAAPRPAQAKIPVLVGGNGPRVLGLGGRAAEIVSITGSGRTLDDGHRHEVDWTEAAIDERITIVRRATPDARPPVLDALVQHVRITNERERAAHQVAEYVMGASARDVLGAPYVLLGTLDEIAEEVVRHRERWGFTSYVVRADAIDAIAALIDRLRG